MSTSEGIVPQASTDEPPSSAGKDPGNPGQIPEGDKLFTTADVLFEEFRAIHPDRSLSGIISAAEHDKVSGSATAPETAYRAAVHALPGSGQAALCLSGGGIRSAAFALGVLQGLAYYGLLRKFHYLSTVSGGGYIGGWLSAWASRAAAAEPPLKKVFANVEEELGSNEAPLPLRELRKRQTYLTPKSGLGSPDTWTAVAHLVRNLMLNWLVFLPLLAALLLVPRFVEALLLAWTHSTPPSLSGLPLHTFLHSPGCWFDKPDVAGPEGSSSAHGACPISFEIGSGSRSNTRALLFLFVLPWVLAFVLVLLGLGFSMVNRATATGKNAIADKGFASYVLVPVTLGAFYLLLATCSRMFSGWAVTSDLLVPWVGFCAAVFFVIRLVALAWMRWLRRGQGDKEQFQLGTMIWGTVAQALAGALIGLVAWSGLKLREAVGSENNLRMIDLRDLAAFGVPWLLMAFLTGQVLLSGVTSHLFRKSGDRNREWLARASGWYGALAIGWATMFAVVLYGWNALQWTTTAVTVTITTGAASLIGGASPLTKAVTATGLGNRVKFTTIVAVLSLIFILCLSAWIAHLTALLLQAVSGWRAMPATPEAALHVPLGDPWEASLGAWALVRLEWIAAAAAVLAIFSVVAATFVNVNYFSLNAVYRNRLARTFLGASNLKAVTGKEPVRNPFDGFAEGSPSDNPPMDQVWEPGSGQPFPVVNMALNLTATENTAWRQRKATAFTVSPRHAGSALAGVGFRRTGAWADGMTLGTAMSVSGAAVSPNWGYHSSPVTSFVLALFNLRLGLWVGNPARKRWKSDGPRLGLNLFWQEALGRTSEKHSYIYLSDGGHFDNLGLYEMIRRRCRTIIVSDAGADPTCSLFDLGATLRKIAIDLDVQIDFDRIDMNRRGTDPANPGIYCAIGTIRYSDKDAVAGGGTPTPGTIVYIKAGLYGDLPADVRAYAAANAKFPHDTTLNQWFTESQFESYRALGRHAIRIIASKRDSEGNIVQGKGPGSLEEFVKAAQAYAAGYARKAKTPVQVRLAS